MVERIPKREVPRPVPIPRMQIDTNNAAKCFMLL